MATVVLAVKPVRHVYSAAEDDTAYMQLEAELLSQSKNTELYRVGRMLDTAVWANGMIQNKYRMTTLALYHLCGKLCPGLGQLANNLAFGDDNNPVSQTSVDLAIDCINRLIKERYRSIDGCFWVIDHRTKLVEGLVGRRYRFVSNWELLQRAKDYVLSSPRSAKAMFAEGILNGRRMIVRFRNEKPAFELPSPDGSDVFFGGFHFANSEVGGYAIRAAAMVLRAACDNKAVSPFTEGGKLAHLKGKKFDQRFAELLEGVTMKADRLKQFREKLLQMQRMQLGLGGTKEKHAAAVKSICKQLRGRGLTAKFAETVIDHVIAQGSYSSQRIRAGQLPRIVAATRTLFDLFNAVTAEAKQLDFSDQESSEQVAYQMLCR